MKDWRDNKYGLETEYSALRESEDFWMTVRILLIVAGLVGSAAGLLWWLLTL